MLGSLLNIRKIPELRKKIWTTILLILVYRVGAHIPCPLTDPEQIKGFAGSVNKDSLFGLVDMFSGGAFKQMTIFALGIMPYITASIILQLLTVVLPGLEKLAREGEAGRKKITQYTRYLTVILTAFQSAGLAVWMIESNLKIEGVSSLLFFCTTVIAITTGTCFIMWLGEKITEHGIGNGISLIIAVGIIASYRNGIGTTIQAYSVDAISPVWLLIIPVCYVAVTALIIVMQTANRKIPIQYARRLVGRREMQGGANFLPLKLNTAGVIPVIFASSILMVPGLLFRLLGSIGVSPETIDASTSFIAPFSQSNLYNWMDLTKGGALYLFKVVNLYNFVYVLLTVFFCYFYTAIQFNPVDTADNLKRVGAFIPGRRPGKNTSDYIDYVLSRITLVGSTYLVLVALLPNAISAAAGVDQTITYMLGGTGLIIVAGVFLDLMKQIESQLLMRHYEGFKYRGGRGGGGSSPSYRGKMKLPSAGANRTLGGDRKEK